ncbi:MAG: GNAT family N-acetyltransferase [Culturomica sp.]|jgi:diamine N-acetyltransferase|nr:GNAT family N-acetyltransferase [Culturomica sp.]
MLQDENIIIRAIEPEDLEFLYKWENDMDFWDVSETITPLSRYALKKYIENSHKDIYEVKQLRLIICKQNSTQPIGSVELFDFDPFHQRAGVGIMIHDKNHRQQGFSRSAINLLLDYAFETLSLNQLYCYIPLYNLASLNLFEGIGFERNGVMKKWVRRGDNWQDVCFLQLLASDWRNN